MSKDYTNTNGDGDLGWNERKKVREGEKERSHREREIVKDRERMVMYA